jgi:hypothetical protein
MSTLSNSPYFISGISIIIPETISTIVGLILLAVLAAFNYMKRKKAREQAATA